MEQKANLTHELIEKIGLYLQSKFHDLGGFFDYLIHRNKLIDSRLDRLELKLTKILEALNDDRTEDYKADEESSGRS